MAAITSQWRRRLLNAYEVKAGMVCLQRWASQSRWGAIQIHVRLPLPSKNTLHRQWIYVLLEAQSGSTRLSRHTSEHNSSLTL